MQLRNIGASHAASVVEVLEALLARAKTGEMISLAYLAEYMANKEPLTGVVGRYQEDKPKLVGELSVMKDMLARHVAQLRVNSGCFGCVNFQ